MTNPFQRSLEPALTQVGSLRTRGPRPGPAPHTRHNCRGAAAGRPQAAVTAHEFPSILISTPHTDLLRNVHLHGTRIGQGNPSPLSLPHDTTRHTARSPGRLPIQFSPTTYREQSINAVTRALTRAKRVSLHPRVRHFNETQFIQIHKPDGWSSHAGTTSQRITNQSL
jgi:hypothetical protein